ncbi:MAG: hypothetical protein J2O48_01330 [Solirubrobacterales bacterium]|nr:hypothetical protein [Solirubrobacterales bacterium]
MNRIRALAQFIWDFVVGDDWRVALGVVIALALTALLHTWVPLALLVAAMLAFSVFEVAGEARRRPPGRRR